MQLEVCHEVSRRGRKEEFREVAAFQHHPGGPEVAHRDMAIAADRLVTKRNHPARPYAPRTS
jgi:hypothetical protein